MNHRLMPGGGRSTAALVTAFVCLTLLQNAVYGYEPVSDSLVYLARAAEFARGEFINPATNWNDAPGYSLCLAIPVVFGIDAVGAGGDPGCGSGAHLCRGCLAIRSGNITDEMIREYIDEQQGEQIADDGRFPIDPS